jgi:hypothetical protein
MKNTQSYSFVSLSKNYKVSVLRLFTTIVLLVVTCASLPFCSPKAADKKIETALDAADVFIRNTLNGNFEKAEPLVVPTKLNKELFERYKTFYATLSPAIKQGYKQASYDIITLKDVNDSTTIINYSNSYKHQPTNLKIVKQNSNWMVDFSYTAASDTTANSITP